MINNLREQLFALDNLMSELGIKYVVTGTLALDILGMPMRNTPDDIDILVNVGSEKTRNALSALHRTYGSGIPPYMGGKCYTFQVAGVKVNAIASEVNIRHEDFVKISVYDYSGNAVRNIRVQKVTSALVAKMKLQRTKDHDFLYDLLAYISLMGKTDKHVSEVQDEKPAGGLGVKHIG